MKKHFLTTLLFSFHQLLLTQALAYVGAPEIDNSNQYQSLIKEAVLEFEAQMGVSMRIPVVLYNESLRIADAGLQSHISTDRTIGSHELTTYGVDRIALLDSQRWTYQLHNFPQACLIVPHIDMSGHTLPQKRATLAHEVFHCFQLQLMGNLNAVNHGPPWIIEGTATWAGEYHARGSDGGFATSFWLGYFTDRPLLVKTYDAYPFFMHLQLSGHNAFNLVREILLMNADSEEAWSEIVNNVSPSMLAEWSSGFFRDETWGAPWFPLRQREIFYPATAYPQTIVDAATLPQTITGPKAWVKHYMVMIPRDEKVQISISNGTAVVYVAESGASPASTHYIQEGTNKTFCYGDRCGCPNGAQALNIIRPEGGWIAVAVTGTSNEFELKLERGEAFCCGNSVGIDRRLVGTWEMDTLPVLLSWAPEPDSAIMRGRAGQSLVTIYPDGTVEKSYTPLRLWARARKRPYNRAFFTLLGSWRGCLETRSTGADQGWLRFTQVDDSVVQTRSSSTGGDITRGDWFAAALCTRANGRSDCRSNYRFLEDGRMKVLNAVGIFQRVSP